MSFYSGPIEVKHLHNAVSREICGSVGWFNVIINMNGHPLSDLYALLPDRYHVLYPDYIYMIGNTVSTKRGVLIENFSGGGDPILHDINNNILRYPNVAALKIDFNSSFCFTIEEVSTVVALPSRRLYRFKKHKKGKR